jgi:hypothetical protein
MPGCVLRVVSSSTDIESLIKVSGLRPFLLYRKDEPRIPGGKQLNKSSGFNLDVSKADGFLLDSQVHDAIRFLKRHSAGLRRLVRHRTFEEMTIDFGLWSRSAEKQPAQFCRFPATLIELLGKHGIALELSFYASKQNEAS